MNVASRFGLSAMALVMLAMLGVMGCSTGQQGVTNRVGTLVTRVSANTQQSTEAARRALEELKLSGVTATSTSLDGVASATTAQGDKVNVSIEREGEDVSKVSVKVGTWGDEATSLAIIDKMRANLKK